MAVATTAAAAMGATALAPVAAVQAAAMASAIASALPSTLPSTSPSTMGDTAAATAVSVPTAAAATPSCSFAHVRAGACNLAVAVGDIVQAIPVPAAGLMQLPRRSGALAGLVAFEGGVVPVVGLERWVELGAVADSAAARIVILRAGKALIGFQADALLGVHRVTAESIRPVHRDADGDELFAGVIPATEARPLLCLLETGRLMALAHAWCDAAELRPGQAAATATARRAAAASVRYALFGIGDDRWAVPATSIARLVTTPVAEMRWAGQLTCGICPLDGRKLPMIDLAFARSAGGPGRRWMAVINQGPLSIGIVADRCDRLVDLSDTDIVKLPGDKLLAGTAIVDGVGTVFVLEPDKLFRAVPEASISIAATSHGRTAALRTAALRTAPAGLAEPARPGGLATRAEAAPGAGDTAAATAGTPYLVFEADRHYASPVAGLMGVVALPAAAVHDLGAGRPATVGWRGETVAVVSLPSIDGSPSRAQPRLAVVLEGADKGRAGSAIAIGKLIDWLPAQAARHGRMRMNGVGEVDVITSQRAHQGASLVVVDLAQMAYLLN